MSCYIVPLVEAAVVSACRKRALRSSSPLLQELPALEKMLWGGSVMLIVDHAINGELFAWTPLEMLKVGVPMALAITLVWVIYALVKVKKATKLTTSKSH